VILKNFIKMLWQKEWHKNLINQFKKILAKSQKQIQNKVRKLQLKSNKKRILKLLKNLRKIVIRYFQKIIIKNKVSKKIKQPKI